jgi:hypothetical protein
MNLGFIKYIYFIIQLKDGKNSFFRFEIGKSKMIAIFGKYTLNQHKMARNIF